MNWEASELEDDQYERVSLNGVWRYVARGRCGIRTEHYPHLHHDWDLGPFWCHADRDAS